MSIKETVVVAYYLKCDHCSNDSGLFIEKKDLKSYLATVGWTSKQSFKDILLVEEWLCNICSTIDEEPAIDDEVMEVRVEELEVIPEINK